MLDTVETRLNELACRAGLKGVPPRVVLVVVVLGVVGSAWAGWRWWPRAEVVEPEFVHDAQASTPPVEQEQQPVSTEQSATVLVHVVGSVRRAGVYSLPEGSRAIDAVDAAGGLLPDAVAGAVNLARPVTDGEQLVVPSEDDAPVASAPAAPAGVGGGAPEPGALVDLNSADAAALETLPGVGPATAEKIVSDREANGPFASVDDLGRVSGIGPKKLDALRDLAVVR